MVSLAKMFRGQDGVVGNDRPVVALRDRAGALPSKAAQVRGGIPRRLQHGRACSCCNPRQGRPRKPYRRSRGEE